MSKLVRSVILFIPLAFLVIALDRFTKMLVLTSLAPLESRPLVGRLILITHIHNFGGAFGLFSHMAFFFVVMGVIVPLLIVIFFKKLVAKGRGWIVAAALIMGGALGNLIDRVTYGYVVDFINIRVWPIFNVADIAITMGIIILFISMITEGNEAPSSPKAPSPQGESDASGICENP
ncbi:MAG: signal peptidase II [Candidatus Eremiobacteraeota bacterium]|nr:signal peptidase II [Candidatus Eremiobacteraeota bacterium]